jgi:large subunit ribosomal protein L21
VADEYKRPPPENNLLMTKKQMYVIVEINGQQFKAEEGKKLFVHHIPNVEGGASVEFGKVLLVDNNGTITVGAPVVEGAKVVCEVASPIVKGDKVLVFKKKRRKGYRKLNGHRQQFTEVRIKEVVVNV